jgi:hypothetical protein
MVTFVEALMLGNVGNLVQEEVGPHPLLHQGEQVLGREMENMSIEVLLLPSGSVADPDPGSGIGAFLTPGSGIQNRFFPDPGSRISDPGSQDHIFKSFLTIFLVKSSIFL